MVPVRTPALSAVGGGVFGLVPESSLHAAMAAESDRSAAYFEADRVDLLKIFICSEIVSDLHEVSLITVVKLKLESSRDSRVSDL